MEVILSTIRRTFGTINNIPIAFIQNNATVIVMDPGGVNN